MNIVEDEDFENLFNCLRSKLQHLLTCVPLLVVLDGAALPQKAQTIRERKLKSSRAAEELRTLLTRDESEIDPKHRKDLARKCFTRSPALNSALIDFLFNLQEESRKFPYRLCFTIAPYEADSQLAYYNRENIIEAILTMDADLIIFGAKKIIYPPSSGMHDFFGECLLYDSSSMFDDLVLASVPSSSNLTKIIQIARRFGILGLSLVAVSTNRNDYLPQSLGGLATAVKNVYSLSLEDQSTCFVDLLDDSFSEEKVTGFLQRYFQKCSQLALEIGLEPFKNAILGYLGQVVF